MELFDNRNEMIGLIKPNSTIAELGVFRGEFTKNILDICNPKELVLIDLWDNSVIESGDVDGNNVVKYNGEFLYNEILNKYRTSSNIKIIKNYTSYLSTYPDNYFDMIYIDADHSYDGCKNDLLISYDKIKSNGFIMGHDYTQNLLKTSNIYNFGVSKAVDEFCIEKNQEITIKALDGCVSYGIRIIK